MNGSGTSSDSPAPSYPSLASLFGKGELVRAAGAHCALTASLVERAGFDAVWASSFEISAARCLPDASLLTMTEFLQAATQMQESCGIPVVADVDTGFGGTMNVAHMVREYERQGITGICIEDKVFPKMNSFVATAHPLLEVSQFCRKLEVAKSVQRTANFHVIARTEALIAGHSVSEAMDRCHRYAEAGADSVLVHSKARSKDQVVDFLSRWDGRVPLVVVPTTYPDWNAVDAHRAGVGMIIYANHALRAMVRAVTETLATIRRCGTSAPVENHIASMAEVFALQHLDEWLEVEA